MGRIFNAEPLGGGPNLKDIWNGSAARVPSVLQGHALRGETDRDLIAVNDEDNTAYIERLERNLEAARKKIEEVRQADEERLLALKKQLSDWMD